MKKMFTLLCILFSLSVFLTGCSSEPTLDDKKSFSYTIAREEVKSLLKSPSTSKFESYKDGMVKYISDNVFEVNGYVDAQNGFGVTLRNNFVVQVEIKDYKQGKYIVRKIDLK